MDVICNPRILDQPRPLGGGPSIQRESETRCAGGTGDLFTCDRPNECTRAVCFPLNDHDGWVVVTADYYDHRTGHLRG